MRIRSSNRPRITLPACAIRYLPSVPDEFASPRSCPGHAEFSKQSRCFDRISADDDGACTLEVVPCLLRRSTQRHPSAHPCPATPEPPCSSRESPRRSSAHPAHASPASRPSHPPCSPGCRSPDRCSEADHHARPKESPPVRLRSPECRASCSRRSECRRRRPSDAAHTDVHAACPTGYHAGPATGISCSSSS